MPSRLTLGAVAAVSMVLAGLITVQVRHALHAPAQTPVRLAPAPVVETARVLSAAVSLQAGAELTEQVLVVRDLPKTWSTSSVVLPLALPQVVGSRLRAPLAAGEPLRWALVLGGAKPLAQACAKQVGEPVPAIETRDALRKSSP